MVTIRINTTHPQFSGLDMKHVRLAIGSQPAMFYNYKKQDGVGYSGTNNKILSVSQATPLAFEDADFAMMVNKDIDKVARTLGSLIDLMRKNLLTVDQDGAPLSPEDVLAFT